MRLSSCVGVVLTLGAVLGGGRAGLAAPQATPPAIPVEITTVRSAVLPEASEYIGTLRSRRSIRIHPQVDGWITGIHVASGEAVRPGASLMEIDSRRQQAAVRGQQANRAARAANLEYWRQQHARLQRLYATGGASKQELEQAETSLRSAEAQLTAQEQQLRSESVQLRYYRVTAPEAGTVGDVPVRVGDLVTPDTLLTTIDHNETLEVYVNVPVSQAARVQLGTPIEILDERGRSVGSTKVAFISPQVSPQQTVLVKGWVDNDAGTLRSAQAVRARVVFGQHQGPVVPVLSVQMRGGEAFIWIAREESGELVAEQRAIKLGPINGQVYPVLGGLKPGERIIVSGLQKLRPGARVTEETQAPASPG